MSGVLKLSQPSSSSTSEEQVPVMTTRGHVPTELMHAEFGLYVVNLII